MVEKSKMVAKKNVGHIQGEHHFQDGHNIQDDSKNRMMTTTLKLFIMSKMVPHQIKISKYLSLLLNSIFLVNAKHQNKYG